MKNVLTWHGTTLTGIMQDQTYFTPEMIEQTKDAKHRLSLELENLKKQYGYRITAAAVSSAQHEFIGDEVERVVNDGRANIQSSK